ncbi:hypothetical protein MASR2M32_02470 [Sphaerotilus sulfidivorans]
MTKTTLALLIALALAGCGGGGGGGTAQDSGPDKTTLSVAAQDIDGDTLHYQWRVTAGHVDDRDAPSTTWTLPSGPGLHFAYVTVTDGRGGHAEAQHAVSSDALDTVSTRRAQALHRPPTVVDEGQLGGQLRLLAEGRWVFTGHDGASTGERLLDLPDVQVDLRDSTGRTVFSGRSDMRGEIVLPRLPMPAPSSGGYRLHCTRDTARARDAWPVCAANYTPTATRVTIPVSADTGANLRLYGHVELADGSACARLDQATGQTRAATLRLLQADGTAVTAAIQANRHGDYLLEAAVAAQERHQLEVSCEGLRQTIDVPQVDASLAATPVAMPPIRLANTPPRITRLLASGPDGNLRGRQVTAPHGSRSDGLPGSDRFLAYKGLDTPQSACAYYRALGLVAGCDAQGMPVQPVTMADWQRHHRLPPYDTGIAAADKASADYINRMDLNLVRRMSAVRRSADQIAFLVCNHPGPDGSSQAEIDSVLDQARQGLKQVACVGMEWSVTPGAHGDRPFTKFVTFGPDGGLLLSVNLDGRGEKYMPGVCVACHGGATHAGRFPTTLGASPQLGSRFLPFDAANYRFGSAPGLRETDQQAALHTLNRLVQATEGGGDTPVSRLIEGWYAGGATAQDKTYVPPAWIAHARSVPGADRLYREVIGVSCRTCHVAFASASGRFDWDRTMPSGYRSHLCGGGADLAVNRSMPNALVTLDRVIEQLDADAELRRVSQQVFGCDITKPAPDPVFDTR